MPLIKADQAVPLFKNAVVLDLGDIAQQARQIKKAARQRADDMIEQARLEAEKVTQTHASQGYDQGYAKGQADGHAQGFEEGSEKGRQLGREEQMQQIQKQFGPLVTAWTEAAKAWDQYHASLEQDTRDSVIELALRLAEKMVYRQVAVDPAVVVDQVSAALKSINGATRLTIHINSQDRLLIDEMVPHWLEQFSQFKQMAVLEDTTIERGGCILVHEHGKLDATLQTQLRRAVELLLPTPPPPESPEASASLEPHEVSGLPEVEQPSVDPVELSSAPPEFSDALASTQAEVDMNHVQALETGHEPPPPEAMEASETSASEISSEISPDDLSSSEEASPA